jgi:hypothetical protein
MKITEKTLDLLTGIETITEREETTAEKNERLEREAEIIAKATLQAELDAAKTAAQAKLAALGLTTDDLKALGL